MFSTIAMVLVSENRFGGERFNRVFIHQQGAMGSCWQLLALAAALKFFYVKVMTPRSYGNRFLTAEWRHLALLNYEVDGEILRPWLPRGTEIDSFNGKTFVSMVGFRFEKTRVLGLAMPFHQNFEEINLRFYVRRKAEDGWRRGVVFVKEIVPRAAIAWVARWLYNENYVALPTGHAWVRAAGEPENIESVKYFWTLRERAEFLEVITAGAPIDFVPGSAEEFIAEHYWGYSKQRDGGPWSTGSIIQPGAFGVRVARAWSAMSRRSTVRSSPRFCAPSRRRRLLPKDRR